MDMDNNRGYPFSSIYHKVLSAIPGWFRDHVWTSMVVNHDWGSIHALAGINGGVSSSASSSRPGSPMDHHFASHDCEALVHRINKSIPLYSSNKSNCRVGERNEPRTNVRSNSSVMARAWSGTAVSVHTTSRDSGDVPATLLRGTREMYLLHYFAGLGRCTCNVMREIQEIGIPALTLLSPLSLSFLTLLSKSIECCFDLICAKIPRVFAVIICRFQYGQSTPTNYPKISPPPTLHHRC